MPPIALLKMLSRFRLGKFPRKRVIGLNGIFDAPSVRFERCAHEHLLRSLDDSIIHLEKMRAQGLEIIEVEIVIPSMDNHGVQSVRVLNHECMYFFRNRSLSVAR